MQIIYYEEHVRSARNLIYCDMTENDIRGKRAREQTTKREAT